MIDDIAVTYIVLIVFFCCVYRAKGWYDRWMDAEG